MCRSSSPVAGKLPRLSIGLPVFNGDRFIEQAVDSILAQTFSDFELIISDNGSTDRTQEICERYARQDSRVRYYRSAVNRGAAWNFCNVFHLSVADYFKWSAADDFIAPRHIEQCIRILDEQPLVVLCYPQTRIVNENGDFLYDHVDGCHLGYPEPHKRLLGCLSASRQCHSLFGVVRRSALQATPLLGNYPSSDYILLAQLSLAGQFYEVPERLYFRRKHSGSGSQAHAEPDAQAAWLDPNNRYKHSRRWLRLLMEYLRSVKKARLRWDERVRCYLVAMKWLFWNASSILREVGAVLGDMNYLPHPGSNSH